MEERKQAAADALMHYSQFAMVCIGEGVSPSKLRLHLLKELSGMPSTLKMEVPQQGSLSSASNATTTDRADRASSSSGATAAGAAGAADSQVDRAAFIPYQDRGV